MDGGSGTLWFIESWCGVGHNYADWTELELEGPSASRLSNAVVLRMWFPRIRSIRCHLGSCQKCKLLGLTLDLLNLKPLEGRAQ